MNKIRLDHHFVSSRKDLLHFVEENIDPEVYEKLPKDLDRWIDELSWIKGMLTGSGLIAGTGIDLPPVDESDFDELGENIFLYRGNKYGGRPRGVWVRKKLDPRVAKFAGRDEEWTHYNMGSRASLRINSDFADVPIEMFLPENFERTGAKVEKQGHKDKRPLWRFTIPCNERDIGIYAKGSWTDFIIYTKAPYFKLTNVKGIIKTTSKKEMQRTLEFGEIGIHVPRVVGYYESAREEFLFLEEVKGQHPNECSSEHKPEIIRQDAEMLARLCLTGHRKMGFTDPDDKIFDGENLFLIDVDECTDLYDAYRVKFRDILLNPKNSRQLRRFRRFQQGMFRKKLRDTVYDYKHDFLERDEDKQAYIRSFFGFMGWKPFNEGQMAKFVRFPNDYQTIDSYMGMMLEGD